MKSFWISIIIMVIFLVGWFVYFDYSEKTVESLNSKLAVSLDSALDENWDTALEMAEESLDEWDSFSSKVGFAINRDYLIEVEDGYKRSIDYLLAKDNSNSSGELHSLQILLEKLVTFQKPKFSNII